MCGIAGIFHFDQLLCEPLDIQRLIDALSHRGPDGCGVYTDGPMGLGHRRLAILDLSELGRKPLQFGTRYWITYNGKVYTSSSFDRNWKLSDSALSPTLIPK